MFLYNRFDNSPYLSSNSCWQNDSNFKGYDIEAQFEVCPEETPLSPDDVPDFDHNEQLLYPPDAVIIDLDNGTVSHRKIQGIADLKILDCAEPGVTQKITDIFLSGNDVIFNIESSEEKKNNSDRFSVDSSDPTSEKMLDFIFTLKTSDSALKVLSNGAKLCGQKGAVKKFKSLRDFVKYVSGCKTISEGKFTINPEGLLSSYKERKDCINSYFTLLGVGADSLEGVQNAGEALLPENFISEYIGYAVPYASLPLCALKTASKLSSFETALRDRLGAKPNGIDLTTKNIILIRAGMEASRELAKIGVILTSATNPLLVTGIAVTGVVTGCIGLYLNYNAPKIKKS